VERDLLALSHQKEEKEEPRDGGLPKYNLESRGAPGGKKKAKT